MSTLQAKEKLNRGEILKLFTCGFKPKAEHKIGMEFERLPISVVTNNTVSYDGDFGVCNLLRAYAKSENWDYITDDYNIIGLKQGHDTITLEPGSQLELSIKPKNTIHDLKSKVDELNSQMKPILDKFNIKLLEYGVSPLSTHKNILLIPKRRYRIMAQYLWGILSDVMMRETAGIQCCIDFENEEDAMRKFLIANKLVPFMTAMFANSPIRGGVETGYKSFRALSWLNTDNDRCGFCGEMIEDFSFDKYIDEVLKCPMIFINREDTPIALRGKFSFEEFMKNGYRDFDADIEDFKLHANLYFPEVRMRNFIEIRNQDCVGKDMIYSVLAIYKGILYNSSAMDEVEELLSEFCYNDFSELRYNVPKSALNAKIKRTSVLDIAKELLYIAEKSLIEMDTNEEVFLDPIKELIEDGICPADILIKNWNGIWNKDITKLVKYLSS
ncbi:glutamate--cysteine ligase [bacterium]|nr:glutamate--cysteine ligase [bacterium]